MTGTIIQRFWRGMPLRRRLFVSSLIGTIPLILLGLWLLYGQYVALRNQILAENLERARLIAAYTDGWLNGQIRTLRTLARSNEVQRGTFAEQKALVLRQMQAQPDWDHIWITDAQGHEIVNSEGRLVYIGDRDYFRRARRTRQPVISDALVSRVTGRPLVAVVSPILIDGEFSGIIAAGIDRQEIIRVFSQATPSEKAVIALWGSDRRLIARTRTPERYVGHKFSGPFADQVYSGKSGTAITISPISQVRSLIGYAPVLTARWTVVSAMPLSTALAPVARTMGFFLLAAMLVLVISLLWSIFSMNEIATQVSLLAHGARAIGSGQLSTRVTLDDGGELRDLADSLNKMAEDLQVLDRMKSDLLSMVSHELKTPLTSIRTSLELLTAGLVTPDNPRFQDLLGIADRQSRRLQDMIENILSVSRLDSGGLAITPRDVDLVPIVQMSVRQHEELAQNRGLTLAVEAPEELHLLADAPKVTLAMNNLLDNAIKFTDQGSITVRVRTEDREAVVTVQDTGIGLTPEVRARLFERFYQAEPLLTRKAGGAGLGLFVTKAIIEGHGGRVFVESEGPGKGSTFGFTLPLA